MRWVRKGKEVRSNRVKKVRWNKNKRTGGWRIAPHWESGEKEVGVGDEEVDISGVSKWKGK